MTDLISTLLEPYIDAPVECDGFTRIAHAVLAGAGIKHTCMAGRLVSTSLNAELPLHFWIQLDDGRLIDYRARLWLGDDAAVPHGVFAAGQYPDWSYQGAVVNLPVLSATTMIKVLAHQMV